MDRTDEFMVKQASSSDESVLTVSASSSAVMGSYAVDVNQLAKSETEIQDGIRNDMEYHAGVSDQTASINDSGTDKTFAYDYDGTTRTLTIASAATLQDLRDAVNNDLGNPGVTATIVTASDQDHLVLSETVPDGSKTIRIDPDGDMTLDGSDSTVDFSNTQFTQTVNASGTDQTFQLQYGSNAAEEITVPTGTTLEAFRDLINTADTGVRATVLDDGGTGSGAVHLVLSGEATGADYAIVLNAGGGGTTTMDGTSLTEDFTDAAFSETAAAQNAQIRLNGYPAGPPWIERSSNQISDVIEGVTLGLVDSGSSATVTVSTDNSAIFDKIEEFTLAFNTIRTVIKEATQYNADTGESGTLLGNYAVQIIKSRLDSLVTGGVAGFQDPADTYSNLQQLGFSTDAQEGSETQGQLVVDTAVLSQALNDDPNAVADLFSAYLDGVTDDTRISFASSLSTATPGVYDVEVDTDTQKGRFRLQDGEWGDWSDLEGSSGNYILTGATGPERGVALNINHTSGTGTHSTVFRLKNGAAAQLSDELTTLLSTSGPLNTLEDNYHDIIDNIEDRIANEERRLLVYEDMLRQRFTRLDMYISQMNSLSSSIDSMISQMPSISKKS